MKNPRHWRQCPNCDNVIESFRLTGNYTDRAWWEDATPLTVCPICRLSAEYFEFEVVKPSGEQRYAARLRLAHAIRQSAKADSIRHIRGITHVLSHDHRWSRHREPLCIDCGAAQ